MDMSATVAPKSDQLNSDDLIAGPCTITITRVSGSGNADQPVNVHFEGDGGKPYRPCKSMRRVMIAAWGADASQYVGRSMTLYRDAKVAFGGMEVGGIRISHMSHIERDMTLALTVTKAKRAPYQVRRLAVAAPAETLPILAPDGTLKQAPVGSWARAVAKAVAALETSEKLRAWCTAMAPHLSAADERDPAMFAEAERAIEARLAALSDAEGA